MDLESSDAGDIPLVLFYCFRLSLIRTLIEVFRSILINNLMRLLQDISLRLFCQAGYCLYPDSRQQ